MRRRWIGVAAGVLTIVSGSIARADDVGCCEAECHSDNGSGAVLHSMQRRDMTEAECEGRFGDCERTWRAGACDANPDGATFDWRSEPPVHRQ
jgi:hypothetical protein